MRNIKFIITTALFVCFSAFAQQQLILEEIWSGAFRAKGMDALSTMKNTNQYTVLNFDRKSNTAQIDLYDFATLNKVNALLDSKDFKELEGIDSYTFSSDEKKILIANNSDQIFRHSFVANFLYL